MLNKRGKRVISSVAFSEMFLLVFAIIAFAFVVGQVNVVSGQEILGPPAPSITNSPSESLLEEIPFNGQRDNFLSDEELERRLAEGQTPNSGNSAETAGGFSLGGLLSGEVGGAFGPLISGLLWGGIVGGLAYFVSGLAGASDNLSQALGLSLGLGTAIGSFAYLEGQSGFLSGSWLGTPTGATVLGVGTAALVFVLLYKEESKRIVEFECLPYEAPLGGVNCEVCNEGDLPCSEYRCKSLGQACELINVGSVEERCVWVNREDVTSPTITPSDQYLTEGHRYTNHETRPPSLGTTIVREDNAQGCIAPFTPLQFGFTTNEPAQCKIDTTNRATIEEMQFFFGENNLFVENHSQRLNLPSPDSIADFAGEEFVIGKDGLYDFYVRCIDANGNENVEEFVFNFCVDPTPDTTPPIIVDTSISSGSPVSFGSDNIDLEVYVNEPADCKWSTQDKAYEDMENLMSCSDAIYEQNARQLYTCGTTLTGIEDRTQNDFYFRCRDQPNKEESERNTNTESYPFTLFGSQELNIIDFAPNETIFGSTEFVALELYVETSNGVDEGVATCSFSETGEEGSYIKMYETNSFEHRQTLSLTEGDYEVYFRCFDLGGNLATAQTEFSVFTDDEPPQVTRVYREGVDALKFVTSEEAECTYSLNSCNFAIGEGLSMQVDDPDLRIRHFAQWETGSTYYVKCRDPYGNQPSPNACTIQVSASNLI